jgi:hypothetical protein
MGIERPSPGQRIETETVEPKGELGGELWQDPEGLLVGEKHALDSGAGNQRPLATANLAERRRGQATGRRDRAPPDRMLRTRHGGYPEERAEPDGP